MRKPLLLVLGTLLLAFLGCVSSTLYHEMPWVEVRTPNFVLFCPMPEAEAIALANNLELFRSVVEVVTGQKIPPSPVPVRVYAFDSPHSYRPFSVPGAAGYFTSSMRGSTIVVNEWRRKGYKARNVLQHEYVHFLLRNRGQFAYPPWYDEGMAEFLSTVRRVGSEVEIGRAARHRIQNLRYTVWLSLEALLGLRNFEGLSSEQVASFYAESWAFVHYLYLGRKGSEGRGELTQYLKALQSGDSNEEAVVKAFGFESRVLGHKLRRYLKRGQYTFLTASTDQFSEGATPQARVPSRAEMASLLGGLSIEIEKFAQAERYYAAVLAARPGDARALAGLGNALSGQERYEEAKARYAAALNAGPDDPIVQVDYANYLQARARAEEEDEERKLLAAQAREHYVRAWKLDASIPETYAEYGATFLLDGEDAARGRETLEHAHKLLPSSPEIKLSLARVYAALDRQDEARDLALVVSTWSHSDEIEGEIQELLDSIESANAISTPAGS